MYFNKTNMHCCSCINKDNYSIWNIFFSTLFLLLSSSIFVMLSLTTKKYGLGVGGYVLAFVVYIITCVFSFVSSFYLMEYIVERNNRLNSRISYDMDVTGDFSDDLSDIEDNRVMTFQKRISEKPDDVMSI